VIASTVLSPTVTAIVPIKRHTYPRHTFNFPVFSVIHILPLYSVNSQLTTLTTGITQ
jgi:hypothetical protein